MKNVKTIACKLFLTIIFLGLCAVFNGCGSSGNINDWADSDAVIRVSNLRGRVIAPINSSLSSRGSTEAYFSLVTTQGTKVFIEDNSNLYAIADYGP